MILNEHQLKQLKEILLNAYKRFAIFCKKYDIKYFACSGTAIGAVRHGGFIPWDDDLDLLMMREECEKLRAIRDKISEVDLELYFPGDEGYWLSYPKIGIPNTTYFANKDWSLSTGLTIDIFPFDEIVDDTAVVCKELAQYKNLWRKYQLGVRNYSLIDFFILIKGFHLYTLLQYMLGLTLYKPTKKFLYRQWESYEKKIIQAQGDRILCYSCYWSLDREIFQKKWFDGVVMKKFEDTELPLPIGYDNYLNTLYKDYMTPPPPEKQVSHHGCMFIDFESRISLNEALN